MSSPVGGRLGPYELVSLLGSGGMGEVYEARDTRLDRRVAIKVLRPALAADPVFRERFEREARTTSSLSHPSVCALFDVGEQDGVAYLVMEYVAGETLAARLTRGTPPPDQALDWAIQCAEGLAAAHATGIVHRDLKPGNIMIVDGRAKLLDFGLARRFDTTDNAVTVAAISRPGIVAGTVAYMSPEQARGESLDHRSDIFTFGIVLYEMLAGVRPFVGEHEWTILRNIAEVAHAPLHFYRPALPAALDKLMSDLLAKSPAERPQSMAEVLERLRAIRRGKLQATAWDRARTGFQRRFPGRRALVAAVVVLAAAGIGWAGLNRLRSSQAAPPVPRNAYEWGQQGRSYIARYDRSENIDRAIEAFQAALRLEPNNAFAHAGLSEAFLRRDSYQSDPQWVRQATEAARRAVELDPDLAAAHAVHGAVLLRTRNDEQALAALKRALDLDPKHVPARLTLALRHLSRGEHDEAEALTREAAALAPDSWQPLLQLGRTLYSRARYQEALAVWESGLRLTPDNPQLLRNLGAVYHMLERPDDAASALQRALEIQPAATVYSNLGTIRFFQGRFSDSAAAFERAVALNPNYYLYWGNLGDSYRWVEGAQQRSRDAYVTALSRLADELKRTPGDVDMLTRRAQYLAKSGDAAAAVAALDPWKQLPRKNAASHFRAAVVYELAGDRTEALAQLRVALDGGYAAAEIATDPELAKLRADSRYHQLLARTAGGASATPSSKE